VGWVRWGGLGLASHGRNSAAVHPPHCCSDDPSLLSALPTRPGVVAPADDFWIRERMDEVSAGVGDAGGGGVGAADGAGAGGAGPRLYVAGVPAARAAGSHPPCQRAPVPCAAAACGGLARVAWVSINITSQHAFQRRGKGKTFAKEIKDPGPPEE